MDGQGFYGAVTHCRGILRAFLAVLGLSKVLVAGSAVRPLNMPLPHRRIDGGGAEHHPEHHPDGGEAKRHVRPVGKAQFAKGVTQPGRGPETNLPLPRFVSLKANEGNARRGPGLTHRVDWVFTRAGMPLMVTAEFGHWRRVQDRDGVGGWVHYALLSGARTVVAVTQVTMRRAPRPDAPAAAILEAGVIARLGECRPDWCELRVDGYRGWAEKSGLWGVGADEIRD